jgi:catechol 2,3-dioxygenase-like lactoylglutathione lyase family enzyme
VAVEVIGIDHIYFAVRDLAQSSAFYDRVMAVLGYRRLESEIGAERDVLIESATAGRTEHFVPVAISGETAGTVRRMAIAGHDGARLTVA